MFQVQNLYYSIWILCLIDTWSSIIFLYKFLYFFLYHLLIFIYLCLRTLYVIETIQKILFKKKMQLNIKVKYRKLPFFKRFQSNFNAKEIRKLHWIFQDQLVCSRFEWLKIHFFLNFYIEIIFAKKKRIK